MNVPAHAADRGRHQVRDLLVTEAMVFIQRERQPPVDAHLRDRHRDDGGHLATLDDALWRDRVDAFVRVGVVVAVDVDGRVVDREVAPAPL
jgi:hypothetical protein